MKNMKRIHSVTIKRMVDESPDTSWLGEYSDHKTSEFSIDRAHSLDCAVNTGEQEYYVTIYDADGDETGGAAFPTEKLAEEYAHSNPTEHETYEITKQDAECSESGKCHTSWSRHEYQYFNPSFNYVDKAGKLLGGNTDEDVHKYVRQDFERMESLNDGSECFLGISADAEYSIDSPNGSPIQTVTSGGLWGIESYSDASYFAEVEKEQLAELREQLAAIGFSKRAIATAFKSVERKEN